MENIDYKDPTQAPMNAHSDTAVKTDVNLFEQFDKFSKDIAKNGGFDPNGWGPTLIKAGMGILGASGLSAAFSLANGGGIDSLTNIAGNTLGLAITGAVIGAGIKLYEGYDSNRDLTSNLQNTATDLKNTIGLG